MEVILIQSVPGLSTVGSVVSVKSGYARNYLIPQGFAVRKTPESTRRLLEQQDKMREVAEKTRGEYQILIETLKEKGELSIEVKVGEGDKLYGTVTNRQVKEALQEKFGVEVDKRQIVLRSVVKSIGSYMATIRLDKESVYELPFIIVPKVDKGA